MKYSENELMNIIDKENDYLFQKSLYKIFYNWYWILCGLIVGGILSFSIYLYSDDIYELETTLLISAESEGIVAESLLEGVDSKNKLQNHIGILQSYGLNYQVLKELNWQTNWYFKDHFKTKELYKESPLSVIIPQNAKNLTNVEIHILPQNKDEYQILVSTKKIINDKKRRIDFSQKMKYGDLFTNEFFSFTINKKKDVIGGKYILVFNDLKKMTLDYINNLKVEQVDKQSELIKIGLTGKETHKQMDYLNKLSGVYINFNLKQKNKTAKNTITFIDQELDFLIDSLKYAGKEFSNFRKSKHVIDLGKEAETIADKIEKIEAEETTLQFKLDYCNNLRMYIDNVELDRIIAPSLIGYDDQLLNNQIRKLIELFSQKSKLSLVVKDQNPSLIAINIEIDNVVKTVKENVSRLSENLSIELRNIKNRKKQILMRFVNLPEKEQEFINIKRRFDINNELYTFLLKKRAEAAIVEASNTSDIQVLDVANPLLAKKISRSSSFYILFGALIGVLVPILFFSANNYFSNTIDSREELEELTKLPVLGVISRNTYKSELALLKHPRSSLAESFRGLRTSLKYFLNHSEANVLAVHSVVPGEGKTFSAVNIATVFAMNEYKVLLVGCDMRKPRLQDVFLTENNKGLSTYLIGVHSINEIIQETDIKNLSIVNSGSIPPNPAELIDRNEFTNFIEEVKKTFDYIILDNAPVSLVTDGILTGKKANLNLFVIRQRYTNKEEIKYINKLQKLNSISNVALVLNDVKYDTLNNPHARYGNGYYEEGHKGETWRKRFWMNLLKS